MQLIKVHRKFEEEGAVTKYIRGKKIEPPDAKKGAAPKTIREPKKDGPKKEDPKK